MVRVITIVFVFCILAAGWSDARASRSFHSAHIEIEWIAPPASAVADGQDLLRRFESAYAQFNPPLPSPIRVYVYSTYDDFRSGSGATGHQAARWKNGWLHLAPPFRLSERNALQSTIIHELAHLWVDTASEKKCPAWLAEGICVWRAHETSSSDREWDQPRLTVEKGLSISYRQAGRFVDRLVNKKGPAAVDDLLRALRLSSSWKDALDDTVGERWRTLFEN